MSILLTPEAYADKLLDFYSGNHDSAAAGVFDAAKAYQQTPNSFWLAVIDAIRAKQEEAIFTQYQSTES